MRRSRMNEYRGHTFSFQTQAGCLDCFVCWCISLSDHFHHSFHHILPHYARHTSSAAPHLRLFWSVYSFKESERVFLFCNFAFLLLTTYLWMPCWKKCLFIFLVFWWNGKIEEVKIHTWVTILTTAPSWTCYVVCIACIYFCIAK